MTKFKLHLTVRFPKSVVINRLKLDLLSQGQPMSSFTEVLIQNKEDRQNVNVVSKPVYVEVRFDFEPPL